ncbi:MAG TPA: type II secretion system protein [Candidatus Paceibacterota bacterium]|nr:type II secretion system protein [Candidatus Paceibacterota bacterium]
MKRGFTLIELLVVIAIIGILASIVLASLSTARSKGNDAKVKEQLSSIRDAAQIYYASNGTYTTAGCDPNSGTYYRACTGMWSDTSSGMASLMNLSNYPSGTVIGANSNGTAYSVTISLSGYSGDINSGSGPLLCIDSTGVFTGVNVTSTYNAPSHSLGSAYNGIWGGSNPAQLGTIGFSCN